MLWFIRWLRIKLFKCFSSCICCLRLKHTTYIHTLRGSLKAAHICQRTQPVVVALTLNHSASRLEGGVGVLSWQPDLAVCLLSSSQRHDAAALTPSCSHQTCFIHCRFLWTKCTVHTEPVYLTMLHVNVQ